MDQRPTEAIPSMVGILLAGILEDSNETSRITIKGGRVYGTGLST